MSTQQRFPGRASWRTAVQNIVGTIIVLGVIAPIVVAIIGDELGHLLPDHILTLLVAVAGAIAAVSATLARIMAIPAVDQWLRKLGLSSTPAGAADVLTEHDRAALAEAKDILALTSGTDAAIRALDTVLERG